MKLTRLGFTLLSLFSLPLLVSAKKRPHRAPAALADHHAGGESHETASSPDGCYRIGPAPEVEDHALFLTSTKDPGAQIKVMSYGRWIDVAWSPRNKTFAVMDHFDGHASRLRIYRIVDAFAPSNLATHVDEIWASPEWQPYDCFWTLEKWNVKDGTINVSCYERDIDGDSTWRTHRYLVPYEIQPSLGSE